MNEREERIAKNENVLRAANRELEAAEKDVSGSPAQMMEVLCECGRAGCEGLISLSLAEYEQSHSQPDRFVVLAGHHTPGIERVVEERPGYLVVEKFGEAGEIAEDQAG